MESSSISSSVLIIVAIAIVSVFVIALLCGIFYKCSKRKNINQSDSHSANVEMLNRSIATGQIQPNKPAAYQEECHYEGVALESNDSNTGPEVCTCTLENKNKVAGAASAQSTLEVHDNETYAHLSHPTAKEQAKQQDTLSSDQLVTEMNVEYARLDCSTGRKNCVGNMK